MREAALQTLGLVQEEDRRCSRCRAAAAYSPGEAHGGASCPPAAHRHLTEQISPWSHGGAHRAAVMRPEGGTAHREP